MTRTLQYLTVCLCLIRSLYLSCIQWIYYIDTVLQYVVICIKYSCFWLIIWVQQQVASHKSTQLPGCHVLWCSKCRSKHHVVPSKVGPPSPSLLHEDLHSMSRARRCVAASLLLSLLCFCRRCGGGGWEFWCLPWERGRGTAWEVQLSRYWGLLLLSMYIYIYLFI